MSTATGTIDPREAEHFGRMAADWWNPKGSSAMLHQLKPLAGRRAADVGCGAGLLAEPLARLGAEVTGLDPAPENIAAAREHALGQGLAIDYKVGSVEALEPAAYDLVTSLEVVEHVADARAFVHGLAAALKPDGLLILSTPNRTAMSRLLLILVGEGTGRVPRGDHDWDKFLSPDELIALLRDAGLEVEDCHGLAWGAARGFHLSDDKSLDYFVTATKRG